MKTLVFLMVMAVLLVVGIVVKQQEKLVGNVKCKMGGGCADFYQFVGMPSLD